MYIDAPLLRRRGAAESTQDQISKAPSELSDSALVDTMSDVALDFDATVAVSAFDLEITNEEETVQRMGEVIKDDVSRRLARGLGAEGALPRPKDGGAPMNRTGQLLSSINVVTRQKNRRRNFIGPLRDESAYTWSAVVYSTGVRSDAARRKANDKRNTKIKRQAAVDEATAALAAGRSSRFLRRVPTKTGNIFRLGSVRARSGQTNAAVAGILSVKPKDVRAKNGDRAIYRVFVPRQAHREQAAKVARQVMKPRLVSK